MSLYFSFTDYDVITSANFVGLDNYISLFQDDQFITALLNTLWYCVLTVPAGVVLALLLDALRGLCRYDRLTEALIRRITGRCAAKQT